MLKNSLESGASRVVVHFELAEAHVRISITDDGSGMDQETMQMALKGGFTTKAHGTGLGLGICRHLLGAHGATLNVESALGRGTTILLTFPVASTDSSFT
jgi:signal transduction histidine kinase